MITLYLTHKTHFIKSIDHESFNSKDLHCKIKNSGIPLFLLNALYEKKACHQFVFNNCIEFVCMNYASKISQKI